MTNERQVSRRTAIPKKPLYKLQAVKRTAKLSVRQPYRNRITATVQWFYHPWIGSSIDVINLSCTFHFYHESYTYNINIQFKVFMGIYDKLIPFIQLRQYRQENSLTKVKTKIRFRIIYLCPNKYRRREPFSFINHIWFVLLTLLQ